MSADRSPGADKKMVGVSPCTSLLKVEHIPDSDHKDILFNLHVKRNCPNLPKGITPLEMNSHVTEKEHSTDKPGPSGGCEGNASSAINTVDGHARYKLTDQQRNELTSIFQTIGQPSPSVVVDVAFQFNLNPIAVEKFFMNAKLEKRISRDGSREAESSVMKEDHKHGNNVGPVSLEGIGNRIASSTSPLGDYSADQKVSSINNIWDALGKRVNVAPLRPLPNSETIKHEAKSKCSALSDGIKECCGRCHEFCLCTCLMCCVFCCCCCVGCSNAAAPKKSLVV